MNRLFTYRGIPLWRNIRVLQGVIQIASSIVVVFLVVFFANVLLDAADKRGLSLGFGFAQQEAGFPIGESAISYTESDSFLYAFLVGVLNTLRVALIGIVVATLLGGVIGVARLSTNWLARNMASVFIETFRNIPLLVQLFFWYFGVFQLLPLVQNSLEWPGPVYFSNRGIFAVWAQPSSSFLPWMLITTGGFAAALALGVALARWQARTGRSSHSLLIPLAVFLAISAVGWTLLGEAPLARDVPQFGQFNLEGGVRLTPEFAALLVGLITYTAAFIAEIVRAGIQSVQRGQAESARALGFSGAQVLRLVVLPQASRVIIPPLISQFLNLTKNSSLAIVVGYPDLFSISRTMINQAGRAVPIFLMIMASYLAMSLLFAAMGNLYNRRVRIKER